MLDATTKKSRRNAKRNKTTQRQKQSEVKTSAIEVKQNKKARKIADRTEEARATFDTMTIATSTPISRYITIPEEMLTEVSLKLIPEQLVRIKLRILRIYINSKTIPPHQITDITDLY